MNELSLTGRIIEKAGAEAASEAKAALSGDLVKVILYGSCARGDYNIDSDIDIALIMKCNRIEAKKYDDALAKISTELAMKYFAIVNFVSIPEQEYLEKKEWYKYFENIDKEGILLYGQGISDNISESQAMMTFILPAGKKQKDRLKMPRA